MSDLMVALRLPSALVDKEDDDVVMGPESEDNESVVELNVESVADGVVAVVEFDEEEPLEVVEPDEV